MKDMLMTTAVGIATGAIFSIFKLPIPAPPVFAGLMGIVGLWIGYALVSRVIA
jgi:XapX domain-containing protein